MTLSIDYTPSLSVLPYNASEDPLPPDTIRMVEEFVQEHSGEYRRRALWSSLPLKMMYQTYKAVIEYLLESGKIAIDANGNVCWIFDPDRVRHYIAREDLRIR